MRLFPNISRISICDLALIDIRLVTLYKNLSHAVTVVTRAKRNLSDRLDYFYLKYPSSLTLVIV